MADLTYLRAAAVVMFGAVCAYAGAELFSPAAPAGAAALPAVYSRELELEGVALRRETVLEPGMDRERFSPGERLPAGTLIASAGNSVLVSGESSLYVDSCDGYEGLSLPGELSVESVSAMLEQPAATPEKGSAKLVEGFYWYYAALCKDTGTELSTGDALLIPEGSQKALKASLLKISPPKDGQRALLFRLRLGDSRSLELRKFCAGLLLEGRSALEIPLSALEKDPQGGYLVYLHSEDGPEAVRVTLLETKETSCLVLPAESSRLKAGSRLLMEAGSTLGDIYEHW